MMNFYTRLNFRKYRIFCGFLFLFFAGFSFQITAQDVHFAQFDYAPLQINPANTGNFHGDWRLAGNFRNQWQGLSTPFRTAALSLEKQVFVLNQRIGVGLNFLNDESGVAGMTYNKIFGSVGYSRIFNNNLIGIGLQAGYVFGNVNSWSIWNDQTGQFDLPSGEPASGDKTSFLDLNFGVLYKRSIHIFEPEAGLALLHLNKPNKSFYESQDSPEDLKTNVYFTLKTKLNDAIYLTPKFFYTVKKGESASIGGLEAGYNILGNRTTVKRIFGGIYLKNSLAGNMDAFAIQAGTTVRRIDIAINYDLTTSELSNSGNMGAFEIAFIFRSISTVLNSYSIPCERY